MLNVISKKKKEKGYMMNREEISAILRDDPDLLLTLIRHVERKKKRDPMNRRDVCCMNCPKRSKPKLSKLSCIDNENMRVLS